MFVVFFLPPLTIFYLFINTEILIPTDSGAPSNPDSENGPFYIARRRNWGLMGRINHPPHLFKPVCTVSARDTSLLIAQIKAISSLAIAVVTTWVGLPFTRNRLNRSHNRS